MANSCEEVFLGDNFQHCDVIIYLKSCDDPELLSIPDLDGLIL